jgi:RNA polymerase sigma factor (sigma-70 family)
MDVAAHRPGPDTELVRAARAGHPAALDDLVALSLPLVYNIVGRALAGHADVDDVVQETLLRMVRHLPQLRDPAAYRSWLVAIAIRQVRDREQHRHAAMTRHIRLDDASDLPDPAIDFAELTVARLGITDQRREVAEATRWLAPEDRTLLALWWLEETGDLGRADLAHALNLSPPHAAVRVSRLRDQINVTRTIVRALRANPGCSALGGITRDWDGTPSPLWRKRLARHVRDCRACSHRAADMLPIERLLAGSSLVPVPHQIAVQVAATLGSHGVPVASSVLPSATQRTAQRAAHVAPRRMGQLLTGWHGALAAVATLAVIGTAFIVTHLGATTPARAAGPLGSPSAQAAPSTIASPSLTPSPSSSPTKAAIPIATKPPATKPAATSSKKGVSVWTFTGVNKALVQSGARWYYTWSTNHNGVTTPKGVDFVPMMWGPGSVTTSALSQAKSAGSTLLGFNEPDLGSQSNMSVDQALTLWPKLIATGMSLGSPAVASGGATSGGWLDQFMKGAATHGYRVDFIALHWYGGDFTTTSAVSQLRSYLQAVYDRYHKPIWLTEYALIDFSHGTTFPSEKQQAAFVTASTKMLASLSFLKRYAWFALPADDSGPSTGLFRSGPTATDAGKAFEAAR